MILNDGKYKMGWKQYAFDRAVPVLYTRSKLLPWRWKRYKDHDTFDQFNVRLEVLYKYNEKQLEEWFRKAIAEYERVLTFIDAHKVSR